MNNLTDFNQDIFSVIKEYLSIEEFNNLINTNKEIKNECKGLRYIKLNRKYSLKYYYNENFRNKILLLIEKTNEQLSLNLSNIKEIDYDENYEYEYHNDRIDFEDIEYIENIKNVFSLDLSNTGISDVSIFSNVKILNLSNCVNVSNVSSLANVKALNLSNCINVIDVSALTNVFRLDLSNCINIRNVNDLYFCTELNLSNCINVTDVRELGFIHFLNLSNTGIFDISNMYINRMDILDLSNTNISDVSSLFNVNELNLSNCINITDVSALSGVHTLNLSNCINIDDISALGEVHTLNITGCKDFDYFGPFNNIVNLIRD